MLNLIKKEKRSSKFQLNKVAAKAMLF